MTINKYRTADYTFLGLCNNGRPVGHINSLIYTLGLVDHPENSITDLKIVNSILPQVYDAEGQFESASSLISWQEHFLPKGYFPQTPCMVTKQWSPIGSMLDREFVPVKLVRDPDFLANAAGVWVPDFFSEEKIIAECKTQEEFFWAALNEVSRRAKEKNVFVSIISKPGWDYESAVNSLPPWPPKEVLKAGRILWKRTVQG